MKNAYFLFILSFLFLTACTSRDGYRVCKPIEKICSVKHGGKICKTDLTISHVEIDDQGELIDYDQLKTVICDIKKECGKGSKGRLVVLFVHGWENSSSPNSGANSGEGGGNLESFKKVIYRLDEAARSEAGRKMGLRRPYGIFVSWRGRTIKPFPIKADFYHRHSAARRVGGVAGAEVIYSLTTTAKDANPQNRVLAVGHSFGGAMLESAISESLASSIARAHAKGGNLSAEEVPGDLVVLINQAESALHTRQLLATMHNREVSTDTSHAGAPLIVSLTSEADDATRFWFPVGSVLGRYFPPFNFFNTNTSGTYRRKEKDVGWGKQHAAQTYTTGHFLNIHSHKPHPVKEQRMKKLDKPRRGYAEILQANRLPWTEDGFKVRGSKYDFTFTKVEKDDGLRVNATPYWIMQMPKALSSGHNDIWNDEMIGVLGALMNLRDSRAVKEKNRMQKSKKKRQVRKSRKLRTIPQVPDSPRAAVPDGLPSLAPNEEIFVPESSLEPKPPAGPKIELRPF